MIVEGYAIPLWQPNQEYTYDLQARTLAAIPDLDHQYVGIVTKGSLTIQTMNATHVIGHFTKVASADFHGVLKDGWDAAIPAISLDFKPVPNLNSKTFLIRFSNGVIKSVQISSDANNEEINQMKALLGPLQVDISGQNLIKSRHNQLPVSWKTPNAVYKTMESSITGECETGYDVSPLPAHLAAYHAQNDHLTSFAFDGDLLHILKAVNYSNCDTRQGYHFGITGDSNLKPNSNQMGDFLEKSSLSRIIASAKDSTITIRKSVTTNRIAVSPGLYQLQRAEVVSQVGLTLTDIRSWSKALELPRYSVNSGNLLYRYNLPAVKSNRLRGGGKRDSGSPSISSESSSSSEGKASNRNHRNLGQGLPNKANENESSSTDSSSSSSEEDVNLLRARRGANDIKRESRKGSDSSSSSSSSCSSSEEKEESKDDLKKLSISDHYQTHPNLNHAPELAFHPFSIGNEGRSIRHSSRLDLVPDAQKLAAEIATDVQERNDIPKRDTLEKFSILTQLIQIMDRSDIQVLTQQYVWSPSVKAFGSTEILTRNIVLDAISQAGTGPAVVVTVQLIAEDKIKSYEAGEVIERLTKALRTPTESILREIFENLVKNPNLMDRWEVQGRALLSLSDLIYRAFSNKNSAENYYPVQAYGSFEGELKKFVTTEFITYLGEKLESSKSRNKACEVLLYIRALGNTGHPSIMSILKKHLDDEVGTTPFQRSAIILALDKLAKAYPRFTRSILYKVYTDVAIEPETRSIAAMLLLQADPPAAMLQTMAELTNTDPSKAVRSVVKSALKSAANLYAFEHKALTAKARAALKFLTDKSIESSLSSVDLRDYVAENMNLVQNYQLTHIIGRNHSISKGVFFEAWKNLGGFQLHQVQVQAYFSCIDKLLKQFEETDNQNQAKNEQMGVEDIAKKLGLSAENGDPLEGQILFKVLGHKHFATFDQNSINDFPQTIGQIADILKEGEKVDFNKLYDRNQVTVAFPLVTGYPFLFTLRMPTLMQAMGEVKAESSPQLHETSTWKNVRAVKAFNISTNVHLMMSTEQRSQIGFFNPLNKQKYTAGHIRKAQVHLPMKMSLRLDFGNQNLAGKLQTLDSNQKENLFCSSSLPFTAQQSILALRPISESSSFQAINSRSENSFKGSLGEKTSGMVLKYKMTHQFSEERVVIMQKVLKQSGLAELSSIPESLPKIMTNIPMTPFALIPYAFLPSTYLSHKANIFKSLAVLPLTGGMTLKSHAIVALAALPLSDTLALSRMSDTPGILSMGELAQPMPTMDQYDFTVDYDAIQSFNDEAQFSVQMNSEAFINPKSKWGKELNKSTDICSLAIPDDSSADSASRREQMMHNAAFDIKQASAFVIDASLSFQGQQPAIYVATIANAQSPIDDKSRTLVFLSGKNVGASSAQHICATYNGTFPKPPVVDFESALKHNPKSMASLHVMSGQSCQNVSAKFQVNAFMTQSSQRRFAAQHGELGEMCQNVRGSKKVEVCAKATSQASRIDQIRLKADVEKWSPGLKNLSHLAMSIVQNLGFSLNEENFSEKSSSSKIEAVISVDEDQEHVNLTLRTPSVQREFQGVKVPAELRPVFAEVKPDLMATCLLQADVIMPFDSYPIGAQEIRNCWYAMVQSTLGQPAKEQVALLVRQASYQSDKRDVLLLVGQKSGPNHKIALTQSSSEIEVSFKGKSEKVRMDESFDVYDDQGEDDPAVRVYLVTPGEAKIDIRNGGMSVYFNGKIVRVDIDQAIYRGDIVGLCGRPTGEAMDDVVTPKGCVIRDAKNFAPSWAVVDEETCCADVKDENEKASRSEEAHCQRIRYRVGDVVSGFEAGANGKPDRSRRQWEHNGSSAEPESSSSSSSSEERSY